MHKRSIAMQQVFVSILLNRFDHYSTPPPPPPPPTSKSLFFAFTMFRVPQIWNISQWLWYFVTLKFATELTPPLFSRLQSDLFLETIYVHLGHLVTCRFESIIIKVAAMSLKACTNTRSGTKVIFTLLMIGLWSSELGYFACRLISGFDDDAVT